ncbi:Cytochrome c3 [Desulfovibrionales bacterium]
MKKFIVVFIYATIVYAFAFSTLYAAPAIPALVKIGVKQVPFDHSRHAKDDCKVCHHKWDDKSPVSGCKNVGCHDKPKNDPTGMDAYKAFHNSKAKIKTCVACHIETSAGDAEKKKKLASCKGSVCHIQ